MYENAATFAGYIIQGHMKTGHCSLQVADEPAGQLFEYCFVP
jgi:hypothetical protein